MIFVTWRSVSQCPEGAMTFNVTNKVYDFRMKEGWLRVFLTAEHLSWTNFSHPQELSMKKVSVEWVPRLLTTDQKRIRMQISQGCVYRLKKIYIFKWLYDWVDRNIRKLKQSN